MFTLDCLDSDCYVCNRSTKKSVGNGFCYPCVINAPENSECIIRPELCLGHEGKGRDALSETIHENRLSQNVPLHYW